MARRRRRSGPSKWDRNWGTNIDFGDRVWCAESGGRRVGCYRLKLNAQRKCQAIRRRGGCCSVSKR